MLKVFLQAPFLRLTLFFSTGILLQMRFDLNVLWYILLVVSLLVWALSFVPKIFKSYDLRWLFGFGTLLLCSSAGGLLTRQSWEKSVWKGVVKEREYRVEVLDEAIVRSDKLRFRVGTGSQQAIIHLPADSAAYALRPSDSLIIRANFRQTDFSYYRNHLIAAFDAYVGDWEKIEPTGGGRPFNLRFKALEFRRYLLDRLRRLIPEEDGFQVASALMFGYTGNMDRELRQTFNATGSAHILSVSGLHFSILYGMLYFLLSFLGGGWWGGIIRQAIILPLLWGFAFLTGLQPCVIRAATMLTVWGFGNAFQMRSFNFNTLFVAAFVLLLFNPLNLFDAGFQLSFSAVLAILILYPRLSELFTLRNPLLRYVWGLSCISVSAQLGTIPFVIYYFRQFPVLFLVTNLIAVPLTAVLLGLIPLSLAFGIMFGDAGWLAALLGGVLCVLLTALRGLESVPNAVIFFTSN
ncbi:MAG: ComEC/Rec2 family competence protein [Dysgonamonadaceae bacterium]|jgi:competence protein ComEC|nr:ComEC/Rec2 family competence protein [Dysgonamonadaceae bacterium]